MSLMSCASGASVWRGYDYYVEQKVTHFERLSNTEFKGLVVGSAEQPYEAMIDTAHPRRSTCNCPHAFGKRIICKHMIALYFTAFPEEAKKLREEADAYEKEEEKRQEELYDRLPRYIHSLKKAELEQKLLELLNDCPEWLWDRFVRDNLKD